MASRKKGEERKDEGIKRAKEREGTEWVERSILHLTTNHAGNQMTGEEMRLALQRAGLDAKDHHAWGALVNTMARRKMIRMTGEWRRMSARRSNARLTPVWLLNKKRGRN